MSAPEMDRLLIDLFSLSAPGYTPDGNPTFAVISLDAIRQML